jgi:hypothetical protein
MKLVDMPSHPVAIFTSIFDIEVDVDKLQLNIWDLGECTGLRLICSTQKVKAQNIESPSELTSRR